VEIGSIHIWLIDDDEIQNFINEKVIQRVIPSAVIAKYLSAQSAIDDLRTDKIKPSIILLDINMPIMSGWDFMKLLEKDKLYTHNDKNISVYILSSSKDPSDIEKMGDYPTLKGFFHKPLNLGYLQNLIDDLKQ
jgi:DNA-binding NarL/FixJ family response regulator